jgi:cell division septum initiation protein DivIVA
MAIGEPDRSPMSEGADAGPLEDLGLSDSGFETVRRGFAPDQVADYLKGVATKVLSLEARLSETRSELLETRRERDDARAALEAAAGPDPYERVSDRLTELMRTFDTQMSGLLRDAELEADRVRTEVGVGSRRVLEHAQEEAERVVAEANADADRIRADARMEEEESRSRAGRLIFQARQEADRAESDLAMVRGSMLDTFRDIRERTLAALGEVEAVIETGAPSDRVVIVDEPSELGRVDRPEVPRPDL